MTTINVEGQNVLDAWRAGAATVLEKKEVQNLITTITDPCALAPNWLVQHSPRRIRQENDDIRDVVDTIFPVALAKRFPNRQALFEAYLARHDRASRWRRNRGNWGTYFERLIRFPNDKPINQLETAINKLLNWPVRNTTGIVFHLSSPATDRPRTRGGPCWHFGEILWQAGEVLDFVVVYRNHDFLNKAFGNFIALGQLLAFVCQESGKTPGRLICHSVHAFNGGRVSDLEALST